MRVTLGILLLALSSLALSATANAFEEGKFQVGVTGGNSTFYGDVKDRTSGNALAGGALIGFYANDALAFNIGYLSSSPNNLRHSEITAGVDGYFSGTEGILPYLTGGVVLVSNTFRTPTANYSGDAFGLYGGAGLDFDLGKNLRAGVALRHNFVFDADKTIASTKVKTVQDNTNVLARIMFSFGESTWW